MENTASAMASMEKLVIPIRLFQFLNLLMNMMLLQEESIPVTGIRKWSFRSFCPAVPDIR